MEKQKIITERKNNYIKNLNITTGSILIFDDCDTRHNLKKIDKMLFDYLWDNKPAKISEVQ